MEMNISDKSHPVMAINLRRRWAGEDNELEALARSNKTLAQISAVLGRTNEACRKRLKIIKVPYKKAYHRKEFFREPKSAKCPPIILMHKNNVMVNYTNYPLQPK